LPGFQKYPGVACPSLRFSRIADQDRNPHNGERTESVFKTESVYRGGHKLKEIAMKLAVHLRKIPENNELPDIPDHLRATYAEEGIDFQFVCGQIKRVERIYVGDEFCPLRLPSPKELARFCRFSAESNIGLTLLMPVLTDSGLDQSAALFDGLAKKYPETEIVANDIGTILFLQKNHPGFCISIGRLFNKGFKDPRLSPKDIEGTPELNPFLSESTFDQPAFGAVMALLKVKGLERDLLPHGKGVPKSSAAYPTAYYFPFGYVTTGRVCRTATFAKKREGDFAMVGNCAKPCNALSFRLKNDAVSPGLIQAGNTVFYLYPPEKLMGLLETATTENYRLIYQGLAI
jgi:hypothetical protein